MPRARGFTDESGEYHEPMTKTEAKASVKDMTAFMDWYDKEKRGYQVVHADHGTLWGSSGGQLEFVSQRFEFRKREGVTYPVVILRFTDHDVQADPREHLVEGKYYEFEFPVSENR